MSLSVAFLRGVATLRQTAPCLLTIIGQPQDREPRYEPNTVMEDDSTLPEFDNPPLSEVVLGIQFNAPANYQHILAYPVWLLFQADFPSVEEMAPLQPQFETFGLPSGAVQMPMNWGLGRFPSNRYWFASASGHEIIQFQPDRLLHNWRKIGDGQSYPRFETILPRFRGEVSKLEGVVRELGNERLFVNQAELSYLNSIDVGEGPFEPARWLSFAPKEAKDLESVNLVSRFVLHADDGTPYARLHRE